MAVARFLSTSPNITEVMYPGVCVGGWVGVVFGWVWVCGVWCSGGGWVGVGWCGGVGVCVGGYGVWGVGVGGVGEDGTMERR